MNRTARSVYRVVSLFWSSTVTQESRRFVAIEEWQIRVCAFRGFGMEGRMSLE
jgi:hypothetical protein